MKTLWAALLGLTALAWSGHEKDAGTIDETRDAEVTQAEQTRWYRTLGLKVGQPSFYEYRSLGRAEARWMGTAEGTSPSLDDLNGLSLFDWTRWLGRAEAHHIEGSTRTAPYLASDRSPVVEAMDAKAAACDLIEENREEGRAGAKDIEVAEGAAGDNC